MLEVLTESELNESELNPLELDELGLPEKEKWSLILKLFDAQKNHRNPPSPEEK